MVISEIWHKKDCDQMERFDLRIIFLGLRKTTLIVKATDLLTTKL